MMNSLLDLPKSYSFFFFFLVVAACNSANSHNKGSPIPSFSSAVATPLRSETVCLVLTNLDYPVFCCSNSFFSGLDFRYLQIVFANFVVHFLFDFLDFPLEILSWAVFDLVLYLTLICSSWVSSDYKGYMESILIISGSGLEFLQKSGLRGV